MSTGTFLILVGPEYEDLEVWYPKLRVEESGIATALAGIGESSYRGKHGYPCPVDGHVRDFVADDLVGILAPGRRLTSTVGIRDDVTNAGGLWEDSPVVVHGNLVSARVPKDLPAFGAAIVETLQRTGPVPRRSAVRPRR